MVGSIARYSDCESCQEGWEREHVDECQGGDHVGLFLVTMRGIVHIQHGNNDEEPHAWRVQADRMKHLGEFGLCEREMC